MAYLTLKDYPKSEENPREYMSNKLNRVINAFIKQHEAKGEKVRFLDNSWVFSTVPFYYPSKEQGGPAEEKWKTLWFKRTSNVCGIVEKDIVNPLGIIDHVYYFVTWKNHNSATDNGWRKGTWSSEKCANVPSYEGRLGTLLQWEILEKLAACYKDPSNKLARHSMVICMIPSKDTAGLVIPAWKETYTFWYSKADEALLWQTKMGAGGWCPWGWHMWAVPKDYKDGSPMFTQEDVFIN